MRRHWNKQQGAVLLGVLPALTAFGQETQLPPAQVIVPGQAVEGELAAGDAQLQDESYYDRYTLELEAQQLYVITLQSDVMDPYLFMLDETEQIPITENNDRSQYESDSLIVWYSPTDETVVLYANSFHAQQVGDYVLDVQQQDPPQVAAGQTLEGELAEGDVLLGDGSYMDLYLLPVEAGQTYTIEMASDAVDAYLIILNDEKLTVAENDDAEEIGTTDSRVTFIAEEDGYYQVLANSFDADEQGGYTLSIQNQ